MDLRPGGHEATHHHHLRHRFDQRLHPPEIEIHTPAEYHHVVTVRARLAMNIAYAVADGLAGKCRDWRYRRIISREQGVCIAVGDKHRIAAVQRETRPAVHPQYRRTAADKVKLGFPRGRAEGHTEGCAGLYPTVFHS